MSSLKSKDRVSLCSFTFADGRRCRTPRLRDNPRLCPYHAQKEARARAAQSLGKDLDYFFSGDYLSACDLSTALGRLIPAVLRGEVKPRAARTVAYLAQTLLQAIHLSKHEYTNAFGTDHWRQSIRNSVRGNYDYRFPPALAPKPEPPQSDPAEPQPQPAQTPLNCHSDAAAQDFRPEESASSSNSPLPHAPAPSPHAPLPPTSAEFAQHLLASRNLSRPAPETGAGQAPQPAQTTVNCHCERSEEPAFSLCPAPSPASTTAKPLPSPATHPARSAAPAPPPNNPPQTRPTSPREPNRDAPWLDFTSNIRPDSKLL